LDTLADSLQTPFTDQGNILKKEIAETLVPTHNHVKAVFSILDKTVDPGFGQGICKFNEGCKKIEMSKLAQQDNFNEAHIVTQVRVSLFSIIQYVRICMLTASSNLRKR